MEILILTPFLLLAGWYFSKSMRTNDESKTNITRIDDKNWIINNEFVSFEEDTPIKRMEQDMEDRKHYSSYERWRLGEDRRIISEEWFEFHKQKSDYPDMFPKITEEQLNEENEKYNQYVKMCDKLEESMRLTKEEFLQKENCENIWLFMSRMFIKMPPFVGTYTIYNEKTARYKDGDMRKKMDEEFEEKWY